MFRFIADTPKTYTLRRDDIRDQAVREATWTTLLEEPNSQLAINTLDETEKAIREKVIAAGGTLVMPKMEMAAPGETVRVTISLFGQLSTGTLKGKLTVSGQAVATIQSLHSTQELRDRGFALEDMTESGGSEISFSVERKVGANPLPEGKIMVAELKIDTLTPAKYTINLDILETIPGNVLVRPINNVVLVSPV